MEMELEMEMEREINNLIMVWSTVVVSSCYCYATTKLVPKGTIRFLMFLPVLCLFSVLPLRLNALTFTVPTAFFVTWLTSFKLLLLAFDSGPLSSPCLPLFHFVVISCLPIKPTSPTKKPNNTQNKESHQKSDSDTLTIDLAYLLHYVKKGLLLIFLTILGYYKHTLPQKLVEFLICIYVYLALEMSLVIGAIMARASLGIRVDRPFDHPYHSTSLQDFWGRKWNRVAASSLKTTIFFPILNATSRVLGRKWAAIVAAMTTFIVSDMMHEIIFYYMGRVRLGGGIASFFIFQGICVVIESVLKKKMDAKWRLPQKIMGPLVFGFMLCTFMWLALPELLEQRIDDRVLEEYVAIVAFVKDLGLACLAMG